jgi:hypothetical protein
MDVRYPPLSGEKQTSGVRARNEANGPERSSRIGALSSFDVAQVEGLLFTDFRRYE